MAAFSLLSALYLVVLVTCVASEVLTVTPPPESCEKFDQDAAPTCSSLQPYSTNNSLTFFPNDRGHQTQAAAHAEMISFTPLIQQACSAVILDFLCTHYFPLCFEIPSPPYIIRIKPCRSLCEEVYNGCINDLQGNGFDWPSHMNCSNFPETNCFTPDISTNSTNSTTTATVPVETSITTLTRTSKTPSRNTASITIAPTTTNVIQSETKTHRSTTIYERPRRSSTSEVLIRPTQSPTDSNTDSTITQDPEVDRNTSGADTTRMSQYMLVILVITIGVMHIIY